MTSSLDFPRYGDKRNPTFFEDFLEQLLEERDRVGLTDLIRQIDTLMITVEPGHSVPYGGELCLMSPYEYLVTLESESHNTRILRIDMNAPDILVREVKAPNKRGIFRSLNEVYPIGAHQPNSRHMGEVFRVSNPHESVEVQKFRDARFFNQEQIRKPELPGNMAVVKPSPQTHNIVGYWERPEQSIRVYALGWSVIRADVQRAYLEAKEARAKLGLEPLLLPIDHLATPVYSQNREAFILEYLTLIIGVLLTDRGIRAALRRFPGLLHPRQCGGTDPGRRRGRIPAGAGDGGPCPRRLPAHGLIAPPWAFDGRGCFESSRIGSPSTSRLSS